MITVQMTLDKELVQAVDSLAQRLGTSRSGFARAALHKALADQREKEQEQRTIAGYRRQPVKRGEFSAWHRHQAWVE